MLVLYLSYLQLHISLNKNVKTCYNFLHLFHLFDSTLNKECVCVCVCVCIPFSKEIWGAVVKNLPTNAGDTGDTG